MRIHKLASVDAFVAIDLDDVEISSGPVRWAPKVLQAGAKDLARSQTYTYAVLGMHRGGASAGISADSTERSSTLTAFAAEASGLVADGTYLPDPAKGVGHDDLARLRSKDPRPLARVGESVPGYEGLSAVVTAHFTLGDLGGRTVAIEGFGPNGPAIAAAATARGARVTALSTPSGSVTSGAGFPAAVLAESWKSNGADMVSDLGSADPADAIFASGADVLFVGSKMGAINHGIAASLAGTAAVVPSGRLPITARALAVLRSEGVAVAADFVALAGSTLAAWEEAERTDSEITAGITRVIGEMSEEFANHDDGPFLAACYRAETFLATWRDVLPFGRPLAP